MGGTEQQQDNVVPIYGPDGSVVSVVPLRDEFLVLSEEQLQGFAADQQNTGFDKALEHLETVGKAPPFEKSESFPSSKKVLDALDKKVYCNEKAKKQLTSYFFSHVTNSKKRKKSIALLGPPNTGKHKLISTFADIVDVPFVNVNLSEYSSGIPLTTYILQEALSSLATGFKYANENKTDAYPTGLKNNADRAIIFMDLSAYVDPLVSDLQNKLVLANMQEILVEFPQRIHTIRDNLTTKDMLTVYSISSEKLESAIKNRVTGECVIGFKPKSRFPDAEKFDPSKVYSYVTKEDFKTAEISPRLVGDLTNKITLNYFDQDRFLKTFDLEDSYLNERVKALEEVHGLKVSLTSSAKKELAARLVENGTNAGGIEQAVDTLFQEFDFPNGHSLNEPVKVDKAYVQKVFENKAKLY